MKVVYICDRNDKCKGSPYCGDPCHLTSDVSHAANFGKVDMPDGSVGYFEKTEEEKLMER